MKLFAVGIFLIAGVCAAQSILPQIADGGNWRTQVVLVNTTTAAATVSLNFFQDTAGGATAPWEPPFLEMSSTQNIQVPAGGTIFLHTPGTATTLTQGWGQLVAAPSLLPSVSAYAIYTYESFNGRPDQDGTSQAVGAVSRILVPFDNSAGFATSLAIVNPNNAAENVSVNIQTDTGTISTATLPSLPANGQMAFLTSQQLPATAGNRGLLEFYLSDDTISIASFRFNPTLALTSSPVFPAIGAPIIGGTAPAVNFTSSSVLPQIADGGNWRTQVVLVNTSTIAGTVNLTFYQDTQGGSTQPWNPPFVEVDSTQNIAVPAGGTVFLHTPGMAAALTQGWGQVSGLEGIVGYTVYTYQSFNGRPDQDGTSLSSFGHQSLVPFDNTDGAATSVAIANTSVLQPGTGPITVNIQTDDGTISQATLPAIPSLGQTAFVTGQLLPSMAGKRGLAEFYASGSSLSIASFRFNSTLALTSSPVLLGTGKPIIGNLAAQSAFTELKFDLSGGMFGSAQGTDGWIFLPVSTGASTFYGFAQSGPRSSPVGPNFSNCTASNGNLTYTCSELAAVPGSIGFAGNIQILNISSASLSFTLTPSAFVYSGAVNGTLSVTGTFNGSPQTTVTVTGAVTGAYSVTP